MPGEPPFGGPDRAPVWLESVLRLAMHALWAGAAAAGAAPAPPPPPDSGVVRVASAYGVEETVRRLKADIDTKGIKFFSETDQSALASGTDLKVGRSVRVGEVHYDAGDDLYARMLDPRMMYSCAYWKDAGTLEAAQTAKIDLVCRKLGLKPGMKVLDIGCGWGGAAAFAAEHYGVQVVGVTISRNQAEAARLRCAGLPVEIRFGDYRNVTGRFDRIYSIGMFEHVGARNHRPYLAKVRELLAPDGLTLLHTIGNRVTLRSNDPWIEKYIFPNSLIPSRAQIALAAERLFVIEDWHDFGTDYERTLAAWADNLRDAWPDLAPRYDDRFRRMWHFYLMVSIASFRARRSQLWQIVMSPEGVTGEYRPVR